MMSLLYVPFLKLDPHLHKKICFICFNESPLKIIKSKFYFAKINRKNTKIMMLKIRC